MVGSAPISAIFNCLPRLKHRVEAGSGYTPEYPAGKEYPEVGGHLREAAEAVHQAKYLQTHTYKDFVNSVARAVQISLLLRPKITAFFYFFHGQYTSRVFYPIFYLIK
jgi:hypothetical protein